MLMKMRVGKVERGWKKMRFFLFVGQVRLEISY
jgi:hypothetical protein